MSIAMQLAELPVLRAVAWALLHFLWQGAVIAFITAGALRLLRREGPQVRYAVACGAMLAMLIVPVLTGISIHAHAASTGMHDAGASSASAPVPDAVTLTGGTPGGSAVATPAPAPRFDLPRWWMTPRSATVDAMLGWTLLLWVASVMALAFRSAGGWYVVQQVRRSGTPVAHPWPQRVEGLARRLAVGTRVRVLTSARVQVPMVIGWMRPVILLPGSILTALTPAQLEAILLHELAHIRRHDYLINLCQVVVETLLFHHPGVCWLSARIREERELCCDMVAASASGGSLAYSRALLQLETVRGASPRLAMAASAGSLGRRVRRLMTPPVPPPSPMRWLAGLLLLVTVTGGAMMHAAVPRLSASLEGVADSASASSSPVVTKHDAVSRRSQPRDEPVLAAQVDPVSHPSAPADVAPPSSRERPAAPPPIARDASSMVLVVVEAGDGGTPRPGAIAAALRGHDVTAVYTTSDRQTFSAARPVADRLGVARISYDFGLADPERFARTLLGADGMRYVPGGTAVIVVPRETLGAVVRFATGSPWPDVSLGTGRLLVLTGPSGRGTAATLDLK